MKHLLYYIWLPLLAVACVSAANSTPETYSIDFSAYVLRPLDSSNLYYKGNDQNLIKLELRKKSRSDYYKATLQIGDETIRIYRKQMAVTDKPEYQLVGQARIPPTNATQLLLLTQNKHSGDSLLNAYALDDTVASFPPGSLRLINITGANIFGQIGQYQLTLKNLESSEAFRNGKKNTFDISIAAEGGNRYHLLYKNDIRITSGSRGLLILTPPIRKGSVRIGANLLLESPNEVLE